MFKINNQYHLDSEYLIKQALLENPQDAVYLNDMSEFSKYFIEGLKVGEGNQRVWET